MIDLKPEYIPISQFQSPDGTKEAVIYFGEEKHHSNYIYGDFLDRIELDNCKFIIFPRNKYTISEIEDEAESYVLAPRKEKVK